MIYKDFYQKYGIRRSGELVAPRLFALPRLMLPRGSVFHYMGSGPFDKGPATDEPLLQNVTKQIPVYHVLELEAFRGNPRPVVVPVATDIRKFHAANRKYRWVKEPEKGLQDPLAPLVYNYAMLYPMYRYMRTIYADYNRWSNINTTMWNVVSRAVQESDRQHFIEVRVPLLLPSIAMLRVAAEAEGGTEFANALFGAKDHERVDEDEPPELSDDIESYSELGRALLESFQTGIVTEEMTQRVLKVFTTPESYLFLEIWKWLGPHREKSAISKIQTQFLSKVNLVFIETGKWTVLNLGVLNDWRAPSKEELKKAPALPTDGYQAEVIQKRYIRLLMTLYELRTQINPEITEESKQQAVDGGPENGGQPAPDATPAADKAAAVTVTKNTDVGGVGKTTVTDVAPEQTDEVKPIETGAEIVVDPEADEQIERDIQALGELVAKQMDRGANAGVTPADLYKPMPAAPEDGVLELCNKLADEGQISAGEYRRFQTLATKYKQIIAPDGKSTLEEFVKVPLEETLIKEPPRLPDIPTVIDKSMLESTLLEFDSKYVEKLLHRDIAACVLAVQQAGYCLTDYKHENITNILGSYSAYTARITPVEGVSAPFHFKIPNVQEDGTYMSNGIKYRMRKQRGDPPIRKISPRIVALTSYYGKSMVSRSEKRVDDPGVWLRNWVMARGLQKDDAGVFDLQPANVFDNKFECPRLYSTMAMGFRGFTVSNKGRNFYFLFDHTRRAQLYDGKDLAALENDGSVVTGTTALVEGPKHTQYLVMDKNSAIYVASKQRNGEFALEELQSFTDGSGSLTQLITQENYTKEPIECAVVKISGKQIPLGFVLSYRLGFTKLIKLLGAEHRVVPAGGRLNLADHEWTMAFEDETYIFSREQPLATLVLSGLNEYHKALKQYPAFEFDKTAVYFNVLERHGLGSRHIREIDNLFRMFVDPITRRLLENMNEPLDYQGLLFRSAELLLNDQHPDELDGMVLRIKGYERMAGAVYKQLVDAVRAHNSRPGKSRQALDITPYEVWGAIAQDPAVSQVSEINPVQAVKEMEAVTYSGTGGRNSRTMTKKSRAYHKNDQGIIGELTVDSSDVGINIFTSANPRISSLYGTSRPYDPETTGASSILSTTGLLCPGSDQDDPKRVLFAGVQHSHGVTGDGYRQSPIRTGEDGVLAQRCSDLFAVAAKEPGEVLSVTDTGITIRYKSGKVHGYEIGRRFGSSAGLTLPQTVVANVKAGQSFKAGEILTYNTGFFEPDIMNPKNVVWKAGVLTRVALMESADTLEDSSAISPELAKKLTTQITKVRTIVVDFKQSVRKLVKLGQNVGSEDILCIIEDQITANSGLFDEETLDTLQLLASPAPKCKAKGVIERIEVRYHGDKADMSDTLKAIANASDKDIAARHKSFGSEVSNGSVDDGFRIEGNPLLLDTAAIMIYITGSVTSGVGDKGVFGNQMKTVNGRVMSKPIRTETGEKIDAIFGMESIFQRIVNSPIEMGMVSVLLEIIGRNAAKIFFDKTE